MNTLLFENKQDLERPYLHIKVNKLTLNGLLDSGSSITILGKDSHKILLKLGLSLRKDQLILGTVANGQPIKSIGTISLPVIYNNQFSIITAHVIPDVHEPLILGIDFWKTFNIAPSILRNINTHSSSQNDNFLVHSTSTNLHTFKNLTNTQQELANIVIEKFKQISTETKPLGKTHLAEHHIDTGDHPPIRQRCYRLSPEKQKALRTEVDEMLKLDVIEPCESPWLSPVIVTPKKDGTWRFCVDSRKLNSITRKDAYKLPLISDILDNLKNCKYLSSIDIAKAFWEIPLRKEDRPKTAFHVPGRGMYQFKVMPFGLTNAPATQQRFLDNLLSDLMLDNTIFCYLDDIVIATPTFEKHVELLTKLISKLSQANITVNFAKCSFFRNELKYLGYIVNQDGLQTDPSKVQAILNIQTPKSVKDVKRFLGTASWYRRFVPNLSTLTAPLTKLTSTSKKAPPFKWTPEADKAFNSIKQALVSTPILACPDFTKPFAVHCDASAYGIGAMLTQEFDGIEKPIAYMSKTLTAPQRNYSITERELLSVITALEHWRCYLDNGKQFTIYTDHSALQWFLRLDNPTGRLARWCIRLSMFNFEIKHKRGSEHLVPDQLSRIAHVNTFKTSFEQSKDTWYNSVFDKCKINPTSTPDYLIKNNKLFKYCRAVSEHNSEFNWKLVIPSEFRESIIAENHNSPTAAHFGIFKTYHRLKLNYYWPGMYKDVALFISKCETCLAYKHQNQNTIGLMGKPKNCSRPFQTIAIDLIGPLPLSRKLNRFILVVTCCFSKYCLIYPIKRATSSIIKHILENLVFMNYGIPETIILDNGPQMISAELKELFDKYKIPHVHYTPRYCPQVNPVERYNKTLITAIASFVDDDHRTWDLHLNHIQFAINSSVNETTKFTPSFLVFGRELVTCGSIYSDTDSTDDLIYAPRDIYAENLGYLIPVFSQVQSRLYKAHQINAKLYDKHRQYKEFNIGDIVWRRNYPLSSSNKYFSAKLAPKFIKCIVTHKVSPLVYELTDFNHKPLGRWHIKDIKPISN